MNDLNSTAVALFIFNRPDLTARVFESIRAAKPRHLLVIADGPRRSHPEEERLCKEARAIASTPDWPCELVLNFSDENLGCKRRLSSGLDWVFQSFPEAIILEDDCVPSASFFRFCSELLDHYRNDTRIMHISGDNFQDGRKRGTSSYYFSKYPHTWGWATWKRAWAYYDVTMASWPAANRDNWLRSILDDPREADYWGGIFENLHAGQINTWDYQWVYACWRQGGLSILPNENLVTNIGAGPDATHLKEGHSTINLPAHELRDCRHPDSIAVDRDADRYTFENHIAGRVVPRHLQWLHRVKRMIADPILR